MTSWLDLMIRSFVRSMSWRDVTKSLLQDFRWFSSRPLIQVVGMETWTKREIRQCCHVFSVATETWRKREIRQWSISDQTKVSIHTSFDSAPVVLEVESLIQWYRVVSWFLSIVQVVSQGHQVMQTSWKRAVPRQGDVNGEDVGKRLRHLSTPSGEYMNYTLGSCHRLFRTLEVTFSVVSTLSTPKIEGWDSDQVVYQRMPKNSSPRSISFDQDSTAAEGTLSLFWFFSLLLILSSDSLLFLPRFQE